MLNRSKLKNELVISRLKKILVPLDGSRQSKKGLILAANLAKKANAEIMGLNVSPLNYTNPEMKKKIRINAEKIIENAKKIIDKENVSFVAHTIHQDNIGKCIVDFASKEKVDLIFIGSKGPDPEFGMFLGSVANYVVHKSKIPVTIIK